jgi:RNA polymerase sigma-70 factor (ECF subfamily)
MNRNRADAEDAVAEAMLRAYNRIPAQLDNTEAWLTRVTINVCRDLRRTHARSEAVKAQYAKFHVAEAAQGERPQPEEECDPHTVLEKLPTPLREVLVLRAVHRAPYNDIAVRLGISPGNVRKRVQHARATLRALRNAGVLDTPGAAPAHSVEQKVEVHGALRGCPSRQIRSLRAYVARHPLGWKMRLRLAELLYTTGAWSEAAEQYRAVLQRRPWLQEALAKLAAIQRSMHS